MAFLSGSAMSQDVRQWLAEIKVLQQKLEALQQERDQAYASAANWRSLYETEAKQRRTEANLSRQTIESLQQELQELRSLPALSAQPTDAVGAIQAEVEQIKEICALQTALIQARLESQRYGQALQAEQAAHNQTRKALTTALGDTMDSLARERTARKQAQAAKPKPVNGTTSGTANGTNGTNGTAAKKPDLRLEAKTPSLELPQFE